MASIQNNNSSSAFEALLGIRNEIALNNIEVGDHQKKIAYLMRKNEDAERKECVLAANYFTKEKIKELHSKSLSLLKTNDFDEDEYIRLFSSSSTISIDCIDFLIEREKEIKDIESVLASNEIQCTNNKKNRTSGFRTALADILMGGGRNND